MATKTKATRKRKPPTKRRGKVAPPAPTITPNTIQEEENKWL